MIIYKTVNLLNGKIYVGKDAANDPAYFGSGTILRNAIEKHGKENFEKIILEECIDQDHLCERESFWIKALDAQNPIVGYNIADGGTGGWSSEMTMKGVKTLGKEGLSSKSKKANETLGEAGRKLRSLNANISLGIEGRKLRAQKAIASQGSEGVADRIAKAMNTLGVEGLKDRARKIAESRKRNRK